MKTLNCHFIVPREFAEEIKLLPFQKIGADFPYWLDGAGRYVWAAQSYLVLRQYREGLTIGTSPLPARMNFAHGMTFRALGARVGEFRVSARADFPKLFDVDFEILQNPAVKLRKHQAHLPFWPVPGIIPRDNSRQGVTTIAYAGLIGPSNLVSSLNTTALIGRPYKFYVVPPHLWHDMSGIDVLVAIRSFDHSPHTRKPSSKLFSAWHAGVPLIAGWDSAFSAVGRPGTDYVRVSSEKEFFSALDRLANDPTHYAAIAHAGKVRAGDFTHDAIAQKWLECFDHQIQPEFERWLADGGIATTASMGRLVDIARNSASRCNVFLRSKL